MGKVRTEKVKSFAHELVERFPDKFTASFEKNKETVKALTRIPSTKLRNRIAGYITRLLATTQSTQTSESKEEEEETE